MSKGNDALRDASGPKQVRAVVAKYRSLDPKALLLKAACYGLNEVIVGSLEKKKLGVDTVLDKSGQTALLVAAFYGPARTVALLLRLGADPNRANKDRVGPLHAAADVCSLEKVRMLLDAGADPKQRTKWGETPLKIAKARSSGTKVAQVLSGLNTAGASIKKVEKKSESKIEKKNLKAHSETAISSVEKALKQKLPRTYRAFLATQGSFKIVSPNAHYQFFAVNKLPLEKKKFLKWIEPALRDDLRREAKLDVEQMLPIVAFGSANYLLVAMQGPKSGRVWVWFHDERGVLSPFARDAKDALGKLTKRIKADDPL